MARPEPARFLSAALPGADGAARTTYAAESAVIDVAELRDRCRGGGGDRLACDPAWIGPCRFCGRGGLADLAEQCPRCDLCPEGRSRDPSGRSGHRYDPTLRAELATFGAGRDGRLHSPARAYSTRFGSASWSLGD